MTVLALTDTTLSELLASSDVPVLVDFTAEWCGPCKLMEPILAEVAGEQAGSLVVASIDVDEHQRAAADHGVMSFPSMLVFVDGEEQRRIVGARGKGRLLQDLAPFLP